MDRLTSILLVAGLGCFVFAFLLSGLYPWMITDAKKPEATIAEVAANVTPDFRLLKEAYPVTFNRAFPRAEEALTTQDLIGVPDDDPRRATSEAAWKEAHAAALKRGRDLYVAEACWHCHSQYLRYVSNEEQRWGRVRTAADDNNALQRPVLWGTRRVGPDLTNEGGRRSNDWHVAHLYDPESTSPGSIMQGYTWYFQEGYQVVRGIDPDKAEREGLASSITYPYPGLYETEAAANEAMASIQAALPPNLRGEADRLSVAKAEGPDGDALALVAYIQWLGTWTDADREGAEQ
jgi:cbb3-type cytochrome c oxidase subunit II